MSGSNLNVTTDLESHCGKTFKVDAIRIPVPLSIIGCLSSRAESAQKLSAKLKKQWHSAHSPNPANSMRIKTIAKSNRDVLIGFASDCGQPFKTDTMGTALASSSLTGCRSISAPSSIIECLSWKSESAQKVCSGSPLTERTSISSAIRPRKRSHLRSVSEPIWSDHHSHHSIQSSLSTETKTIAPKRRKLNCSSFVRVIGRQSTSKSKTSKNGIADSHFQSLSVQDPPPLTLSYLGNECTTPAADASSDDLSVTEDIDIAAQSGKQSNMERKERSLNGLDPFKLGGASHLDIDLFNDRMDFFQL